MHGASENTLGLVQKGEAAAVYAIMVAVRHLHSGFGSSMKRKINSSFSADYGHASVNFSDDDISRIEGGSLALELDAQGWERFAQRGCHGGGRCCNRCRSSLLWQF